MSGRWIWTVIWALLVAYGSYEAWLPWFIVLGVVPVSGVVMWTWFSVLRKRRSLPNASTARLVAAPSLLALTVIVYFYPVPFAIRVIIADDDLLELCGRLSRQHDGFLERDAVAGSFKFQTAVVIDDAVFLCTGTAPFLVDYGLAYMPSGTMPSRGYVGHRLEVQHLLGPWWRFRARV